MALHHSCLSLRSRHELVTRRGGCKTTGLREGGGESDDIPLQKESAPKF